MHTKQTRRPISDAQQGELVFTFPENIDKYCPVSSIPKCKFYNSKQLDRTQKDIQSDILPLCLVSVGSLTRLHYKITLFFFLFNSQMYAHIHINQQRRNLKTVAIMNTKQHNTIKIHDF